MLKKTILTIDFIDASSSLQLISEAQKNEKIQT